jgi:glycosyltransferase involved in cell wall biosynthesis
MAIMQEASQDPGRRSFRLGIVTPSYNQAVFIRQTIESVLSQDYADFDYWVMDGGSTDGTCAILKEYERDPRFHWRSEKDAGQGDAINKGWARCTGEILAWINSDDYYLPGAFRAAVDGFAKAPEAGVVFGLMSEVDEGGRVLSAAVGYRQATVEAMLKGFEMPYQPASFFRREIAAGVGGLNASWQYILDYDLLLRILASSPAVFHKGVLAAFRIQPKSKTQTKEAGFGEELLRLAEFALAHRELYPGLAQLSAGQLRSEFLRRAAKHFNLGGRFFRASSLLLAAAKCYPHCLPGVALQDFPRLLVRRIVPFRLYNYFGLKLRTVRQY